MNGNQNRKLRKIDSLTPAGTPSFSRTTRQGLTEPALAVLARAAYKTLGLESYFTAGEKEVRAWTIPSGATGPEAAGVIHTDFEKGFIRAEVYTLEDLEEYGSEQEIKKAGKLRVEGKAYVVQDGDICHFRVG